MSPEALVAVKDGLENARTHDFLVAVEGCEAMEKQYDMQPYFPSPGTRERGAEFMRRGEGAFRDSSFVIRAFSLFRYSILFFHLYEKVCPGRLFDSRVTNHDPRVLTALRFKRYISRSFMVFR